MAIQTGLRVSELSGFPRDDVVLGTGAHLRCEGKRRKERCTPLRQEVVEVLAEWFESVPLRHDAGIPEQSRRAAEPGLAKVTPLDMPPGRFRPDDELLAFLEGL